MYCLQTWALLHYKYYWCDTLYCSLYVHLFLYINTSTCVYICIMDLLKYWGVITAGASRLRQTNFECNMSISIYICICKISIHYFLYILCPYCSLYLVAEAFGNAEYCISKDLRKICL